MAIKNVFSATAIFLVVALSGCGQSVVTTNPTPSPTSGNSNINNSGANLTFSKVSSARESTLNSLITSLNPQATSSGTNTSQPQTGAPVSGTGGSAPSTADSAVYPGYYPNYYSPYGNFEQYVVINYEEAKKDGFKGTFQTVLNQVVKPIIASLASDVRLVSSNGSTDDTGVNITTATDLAVRGYSVNQWQFTYVSASKKEVYTILVSDKETLILKQTWGILNLNTDEIKTDSNSAIQIIKNAVKNRDFVSPDNSTINYGTGAQVLYDLPANTTWYFYLSNDKGALIWNINFNLQYSAVQGGTTDGGTVPAGGTGSGTSSSGTGVSTPGSTGIGIYYSGGYARVDAKTGNILSLSRPVNYGYGYAVPPTAVKAQPVT